MVKVLYLDGLNGVGVVEVVDEEEVETGLLLTKLRCVFSS